MLKQLVNRIIVTPKNVNGQLGPSGQIVLRSVEEVEATDLDSVGKKNQCTGNSNEGKDCNQEDCQWSAWSRSQWSNSCKIYRYCPEQNRCEGNTQEKTIPNCKSGKPKRPTS